MTEVANTPYNNAIDDEEETAEYTVVPTNRGDEEILEGATILGNDNDVYSSDDEEDDDVVIHIQRTNTSRRASGVNKYIDRASRSYVRPQQFPGSSDNKQEIEESNKLKLAKELKALRFSNHRTAFDVDIDTLENHPWRKPNANMSDYFNYGFNEDTWRIYAEKQLRQRAAKGQGPFHSAAAQLSTNIKSASNQAELSMPSTNQIEDSTIVSDKANISSQLEKPIVPVTTTFSSSYPNITNSSLRPSYNQSFFQPPRPYIPINPMNMPQYPPYQDYSMQPPPFFQPHVADHRVQNTNQYHSNYSNETKQEDNKDYKHNYDREKDRDRDRDRDRDKEKGRDSRDRDNRKSHRDYDRSRSERSRSRDRDRRRR